MPCTGIAIVAWRGLPDAGSAVLLPCDVMFTGYEMGINADSLHLMAPQPSIDPTDRKIVALLRENARRSFKDIGKHVNLSAPAVKRRVDRLERDGVIRGYTAVIDAPAFGWHTEAFVDLYCEGRMPATAIKRAAERESSVVSAHARPPARPSSTTIPAVAASA